MPLEKRVLDVYLFENGTLGVTDIDGQQIGELQGLYSIEKHKRILLERFDDCVFRGFEMLPVGFHKTANEWADYYRGRNLSWKEIQEL